VSALSSSATSAETPEPTGAGWVSVIWQVLRETDPSPAARFFDIPGIATLSGALFLLIWGLIKGPDYGWSSAPTLAFLGAVALVGLLFVLRQARAAEPLLPLRLFRSASLSAGVVLVILLMFAMFGAMFFMTFYLENVHGLDPIAAGAHLEDPFSRLQVSGEVVLAAQPVVPHASRVRHSGVEGRQLALGHPVRA
jgi:hypothetical protein